MGAALCLSSLRRFGRPTRRGRAEGGFPPGLGRIRFHGRFEFPFQFGQLLWTVLQASFEPADLFLENLQLHNEIGSTPATTAGSDGGLGFELMRKPR